MATHGIRWVALTAVMMGAAGCASTPSATEGEASRADKDTQGTEETRAVWERAAAKGVAFRAVGQEPGWVVEVFEGDAPRLEAQVNYGERSVVLNSVEHDGGVYSGTADDGTMVRLTLRNESCVDPMSGESFSTHATLELGTEIFRGCGRTLSR